MSARARGSWKRLMAQVEAGNVGFTYGYVKRLIAENERTTLQVRSCWAWGQAESEIVQGWHARPVGVWR